MDESTFPEGKARDRHSSTADGMVAGWWRLLWGAGIVYIAAIGIFAIEELQRREDARSMFKSRANDVAAAVVALGRADGAPSGARRADLEHELTKLRELDRRLTALILTGSVHTKDSPEGTLRQLLCEFTAIETPKAQCDVTRGSVRDLFGYIVLKRPAERTATGDVLAVLVVVAAVGGALVRLYLPGARHDHSFRMVMQAVGGGVVCYLAISGGTLIPSDVGVATVKNPATASLLGFLSGMFATRVFELISELVDSWIKKLSPSMQGKADPVNRTDEASAPRPSESAPVLLPKPHA